jgi:hypothetical protein
MQYLRIKNWATFQQCDRNAPWIKFYTTLLQNYEFLNQSDNGKASFCCLLLYAGANGNKIPNDGKFLSSIFCMDNDVPLDKFIENDFLEEWTQEKHDKYMINRTNNEENRKKRDRERYHRKRRSESEKRISESENAISALPETETETETDIIKVIPKKKNRIEKPQDVSEQTWEDFTAHRKAKKASVTQTVINGYRTEADKAGFTLEQALIHAMTQGWQGFKAEWVKKRDQNGKSANEELREYLATLDTGGNS